MIDYSCNFILPIEYTSHFKTPKNIIDDLEIISLKNTDTSLNNIDISANDTNIPSLYVLLNPQSNIEKLILTKWSENYTDNIEFLKHTQNVISCLFDISDSQINSYNYSNKCANNMLEIFNELKSENDFKSKYFYIDVKFFEKLNENASAMQALCVYNMASPLITLITPIIFLILPFFLLKIQGIPISVNQYLDVIKKLLSNHALGRLFTQFGHVDWDKKIYLIFSFGFYLLQIYQNMLSCYRFYTNMSKIHNYIQITNNYIEHTIQTIDIFEKQAIQYKTYSKFLQELSYHKNILIKYGSELKTITPWKLSILKAGQIGKVMQQFYLLHCNTEFNSSLAYSLYFHSYISNILNIKQLFEDNSINKADFSSNKKDKNNKNKNNYPIFKNAYYPPLFKQKQSIVRCSYKLNKNIIVTGPNASGKTTFLKTTILNILFSQQCGFGFYEKALFNPYRYLHCYLNIPDTSARDSLFQAEARRCKEILDSISTSNSKENHFCIFDELYSGTNPYEAVASAYAFLTYLSSQANVKFMLTTHFLDLCDYLRKNKEIKNMNMLTIEKENELIYTYKVADGISKVQGGIKVLRELNYPEEIINSAYKILNNSNTN